MFTEINGYFGGSFSGKFKDSEGKEITYSKVLILPLENSTEFLQASVDSNLKIDNLKRFEAYSFKCDLKGDKVKVQDVFALTKK